MIVAMVAVTMAVSTVPAADRQSQTTAPQPGPPAPSTAAGRGSSPFVPPEPLDFAEHDGWTSIFDGRTLAGWSGNPDVWRVEDGAIAAVSTAERRVGSTHIIWSGGEPADFELKLEMKLEGDIHSGIAYRSAVDVNRQTGRQGAGTGRGGPQVPSDPRWTLYGPGLDFDQDRKMAGNVEERGTPRREVAWRGGMVRAESGKRPRLIGTLGDAAALMGAIKADGWNQVHIVARGNTLTHIINGQVMAVLVDDDPTYFKPAGKIGLQIEMFGLGTVRFKDIWLKNLKP
jgi:3-keto-disaccharide hydrolase